MIGIGATSVSVSYFPGLKSLGLRAGSWMFKSDSARILRLSGFGWDATSRDKIELTYLRAGILKGGCRSGCGCPWEILVLKCYDLSLKPGVRVKKAMYLTRTKLRFALLYWLLYILHLTSCPPQYIASSLRHRNVIPRHRHEVNLLHEARVQQVVFKKKWQKVIFLVEKDRQTDSTTNRECLWYIHHIQLVHVLLPQGRKCVNNMIQPCLFENLIDTAESVTEFCSWCWF